jgi:hypothetical protein
MPDFDTAAIRDGVERLRIAAPDIFGASEHRFTLNAPRLEADVRVVEQQHAIRLPADYRRFLLEAGNGGAGPYYGVFPLESYKGVAPVLTPGGGDHASFGAWYMQWLDDALHAIPR